MTSVPYPSTLHTREQMHAYLNNPVTPRMSLATLRAALWTWRALRCVERELTTRGVRASVPVPPILPAGARRGVDAILRRRSATCLERALVYQTWLAAQEVPCEVVVGVSGAGPGMQAHAWLDIESADPDVARYQEIHRIAPTT